MSWRTRWMVREYVLNSIWIVPAIFAIAAIALGMFMATLLYSLLALGTARIPPFPGQRSSKGH